MSAKVSTSQQQKKYVKRLRCCCTVRYISYLVPVLVRQGGSCGPHLARMHAHVIHARFDLYQVKYTVVVPGTGTKYLVCIIIYIKINTRYALQQQ